MTDFLIATPKMIFLLTSKTFAKGVELISELLMIQIHIFQLNFSSLEVRRPLIRDCLTKNHSICTTPVVDILTTS